ncbi:MAG TPA: bifunctional nuclease family protein [Planctomycetota bacterium]|jgi:hypothetical protein|nr:bifunctional nuclease family protein [Planctomycetota bacterium]OQC20316.1 MAG: hypothetical protein BWX69_01958 [Planctomycetes bacterium ADurb.Bin069]NMD36167.1 bifunctional nuclease family protein [Planctomycetota bacterium]HNR98269.1 bifunctional nuclease family protein [Planctomycetota bacterium]HNU24863.1 bifunctional nuclease family protein [Planctomycetota bacterium]
MSSTLPEDGGLGVFPVAVRKVVVQSKDDGHLVFLQQVGGDVVFPIAVGLLEAAAIAHFLNGAIAARPVTHELFVSAIGALGGAVKAAVIETLLGGVFYAKLIIVASDGARHELDCRPSDGICAALEAGAPIFATREVLARVSSATP